MSRRILDYLFDRPPPPSHAIHDQTSTCTILHFVVAHPHLKTFGFLSGENCKKGIIWTVSKCNSRYFLCSCSVCGTHRKLLVLLYALSLFECEQNGKNGRKKKMNAMCVTRLSFLLVLSKAIIILMLRTCMWNV